MRATAVSRLRTIYRRIRRMGLRVVLRRQQERHHPHATLTVVADDLELVRLDWGRRKRRLEKAFWFSGSDLTKPPVSIGPFPPIPSPHGRRPRTPRSEGNWAAHSFFPRLVPFGLVRPSSITLCPNKSHMPRGGDAARHLSVVRPPSCKLTLFARTVSNPSRTNRRRYYAALRYGLDGTCRSLAPTTRHCTKPALMRTPSHETCDTTDRCIRNAPVLDSQL